MLSGNSLSLGRLVMVGSLVGRMMRRRLVMPARGPTICCRGCGRSQVGGTSRCATRQMVTW